MKSIICKQRLLATLCVVLFGLAAGAADSKEYFVRQDGGSDGYDGLAETWDGTHGPKQTIQAAVDKAAAGDTVTVLPGTYETGATYDSNAGATSNRVAVNKAITLRSRDGAAATIIKGAADFAGEPEHGLGPAAIRCLYVANVAAVVQGFTLTGGYVNQGTGADGNGVRAGGVLCAGSSPIIADCVISDNVATRGGAAFEGKYVRTVFKGNRVYNTAGNKTRNGAVCRTCSLYGCLIVGNGASDCQIALCSWMREIVGCTFADNYVPTVIQIANGTAITSVNCKIKNCYLDGASITTTEEYSTIDHTVTGWGELVAPILGDYRPLAGGALAGAGDSAALDLYPAGFRDKDIFGNLRTTGGQVSIGAVEPAVTPQGGRVILASNSSGATVNGTASAQPTNYLHAAEWPKQVYLRPAPSLAANFFCHLATNTSGGVTYPLFNDRQGGYWLTLPKAGETLTLTPKTGTVKYVKADAEDGGDGSEKNPYNTLSAAADNVNVGGGQYFIIKVGPGTYRTGGGNFTSGTTSWGNARVTLSRCNILLTSTDGAEDTIIEGQAAANGGCGEDAYRCVILGTSSYHLGVSGFTLKNGYSQAGSGGGDAKGQGGAYRTGIQSSSVNAARHQVLDSVIDSCRATRAPGGYGGWMVRCLVKNCVDDSNANATTRECVMSSCVLYDNTATHVVVGQNVRAFQCSGVGLEGKANYYYTTSNGGTLLANCLFLDGNCNTEGTTEIYNSFAEVTSSQKGSLIYGQACVMDKAGRDLRPLATSPLVGLGGVEAPDWAKYSTSDFENNPLTFTDGKPTIGAYQQPVAAVVVEPGPFVTSDQAGTNAVEQGESLTVTISSEKRKLLGIRVDGEFLPGVTSWTGSPAVGTTVRIEGVTATDWYVDADKGNDANDGFTLATAKKTLVEVMSAAVAGDTVHAAEGVYREGKDRPAKTKDNDTAKLYSRVIIPAGVTLVADGRQEATVIEGGPASGPEEQGSADNTQIGSFQECFDNYGMGADAVRCVLMMPGATLRGFTLTRAATGCANSANSENCLGAVMGRNFDTCLVEDCLFVSNCVGRGTAAFVTLNRCVFRDNVAAWNCSVARFSELHNCFATGNCGAYVADVCLGFYNCTFVGNWSGIGRSSQVVPLCYQVDKSFGDRKVKLVNSIVLQDTTATGTSNSFDVVVNSVVSPKCRCFVRDSSVNLWTAEKSEVLDAEGCPLLDGPATDAADASWYPAEWGDRDAFGGQRVYNDGKLDVGGVEGDWRATYAAALTPSRRLNVTAADPSVRLANGGTGVEIPSGALRLTWGRDAKISGGFRATVTGGGVLTITRGGVQIAEVRAGDAGEFRLDNLEAGTALAFTYTPGEAGNEGVATLSDFCLQSGMVLIVR